MTLHIEYQSSDSEQQYTEDLVSRFLLNEMPGVSVNGKENVVDKITSLLMGTRHTRLAGCPNPESQVLIRGVVRGAMEEGRAIPILVPSGPKKNAGGPVDLAELSAIKTLVCLQESVQKVYEPGLSIRVRLENATGLYLEGPEALPAMDLYCSGFAHLCKLMSNRVSDSQFIFPRMEAEGALADQYLDKAKEFAQVFQKAYDTGTEDDLVKAGWSGGLSDDWKRYLDGRYVKIYPHFTQQQRNEMASKYLGNLLARVKLGLRGDDPEWQVGGRHIEIGFALPAPNAPLASCRVFYRTMSTRQTKLHMPFWRSKGFFRIVDGQMKMGLVASTDTGNATYIPGVLRLIDSSGANLKVEADMLASVG